MLNTASGRYRAFAVTVSIPSGAALLLHAYLGSYTRLIADDFCSAYFARRLGLLRSIWYWFNNWSGRYTAYGMDWLVEKIGMYALPVILPFALLVWLVFTVIAIYLHLRSALHQGRTILTALSLGTVFLFVVLLLSPNLQQSLYWWNGMRSYSLPLILLTIYAALFQIGTEKFKTQKEMTVICLISFLFTLINGGLGETYVAFQLALFSFLVTFEWLAHRDTTSSRFRFLLAGLIGSIAAIIIVVSAPGNITRQSFFPPHPSVGFLFKVSIKSYFDFIFNIFQTPEKITGLLGALLAAAWLGGQSERVSKGNRWLVPILFLGAFVLSFACFVPGVYAMSEPSPVRTIIIPVFILVAGLLYVSFLVGQRIKASNLISISIENIISITAVILITYSALVNLQYLYNSRTVYIEFSRKWDEVDALILNAKINGKTSVLIPALHAWTGPGGDPTDNPKYWVNQCYSLYYDITVLGPVPDQQ